MAGILLFGKHDLSVNDLSVYEFKGVMGGQEASSCPRHLLSSDTDQLSPVNMVQHIPICPNLLPLHPQTHPTLPPNLPTCDSK